MENALQIHIGHNKEPLIILDLQLVTNTTYFQVDKKDTWFYFGTYHDQTPRFTRLPENALSNAAYPLRIYISKQYMAITLLSRPLPHIERLHLAIRPPSSFKSNIQFIEPIPKDLRDTLLSLGLQLTICNTTTIKEMTFS